MAGCGHNSQVEEAIQPSVPLHRLSLLLGRIPIFQLESIEKLRLNAQQDLLQNDQLDLKEAVKLFVW